MAHPYRSAGRAGAKTKFKAMLGTTQGAKHMNDDTVVKADTPVHKGIEDVKIMAKAPPRRLDRARGGKVGKGVTVNVIVPPAKDNDKPMLPPMPPPMPPMAGPPGGMPPKPPMPMGQTPPGPGAGLPLPRARGGSVKRAMGGPASNWAFKQDKGDPFNVGTGDPARKGMTRTLSQAADDVAAGRVTDVPLQKDRSRLQPGYARGGYIAGKPGNSLKQWATYARKNSYHKKSGGGITKAKLTGGADSGVGRLQHSKAQHKDK